MACMNKFAIDEEKQCDIAGVHFIKPWLQNSSNLFNIQLIQKALENCPKLNLHFIFAAYTTDFDQTEIKKVFESAMSSNRIEQANMTFFEMIRAYCISHEKCKKFYKQTEITPEKLYLTNPDPSGFIVGGLAESIGNDLDQFSVDENWEIEQNSNTFHVSMLTINQMIMLANGDVDYMSTFWMHQSQGMNPG